MTTDYQASPELNELVAAAAEGALDERELARLNALLRDERARAFYIDYMEVHALLQWRHGGVEPLQLPLAAPAALDQRRSAPAAARYAGFAAAALACAALAAMVILSISGRAPWQQPDEQPQPIAVVLSGDGVHWNSEALVDGQRKLLPGRQTIESGVAHIELSSGVLLAAAGPVDFEIESADRIHLHHGKLHIYSPLVTRGFTVTTPRGVQIVDLGTRFGVWVDDAEAVHVHLFEGRLRINNEQELAENQAVTVDAHGRLKPADIDEASFPPLYSR